MDRLNILFCSYRDWATDAVNRVYGESFSIDYRYQISNPHELENTCKTFRPDLIFFVGWSWRVPDHIIDSYRCLCIHPSELPKYRGGSPIQNQIIDSVTDSAVTLFVMDHGIDTGDIVLQKRLNLNGDLVDILERISYISSEMIQNCISYYRTNKKLKATPQNHNDATYCKRRTPDDSEISINDLNSMTAIELYNKIRCLQDPYPNAYIKLGNGEKLYIVKSKLD